MQLPANSFQRETMPHQVVTMAVEAVQQLWLCQIWGEIFNQNELWIQYDPDARQKIRELSCWKGHPEKKHTEKSLEVISYADWTTVKYLPDYAINLATLTFTTRQTDT